MNYIRMMIAFFWVAVAGEVAYRVNFFFQLVQSLVSLGVAIAGLGVVFNYTSALGGWGKEEILALVGVYLLVGGIIGLVIQPGMEQFIESVRDGTLDFTLTKPEDAQLLVSIRQVNIWSFIDVALGLGVLAFALVRLGQRVGGLEAGEFLLMMACGTVIIYSFFLILATLSFWFVRVENFLVIFQSMYEAGPLAGKPLPGVAALRADVHRAGGIRHDRARRVLTGRLTWVTLVIAVGIAAFLLVVLRFVWRIGLRRYSGTSA